MLEVSCPVGFSLLRGGNEETNWEEKNGVPGLRNASTRVMVSFLACEVSHVPIIRNSFSNTDRDAPGIYVVQMHYIQYKTVKLLLLSAESPLTCSLLLSPIGSRLTHGLTWRHILDFVLDSNVSNLL